MTLTPEEKQLAITLNFDEDVLRLVKSELQKPLEPFEQFVSSVDGREDVRSSADILDGKGFVVKLAEEWVWIWEPDYLDLIHRMRAALIPLGYMAFLTEAYNPQPCLGILKTLDQNEIIRVVKTRGWGFDDKFWSAEELIVKLEEWRQLCDFNIIGADSDNIKLEFKTLPEDLVSFADGINYLCWELQQIYKVNPYTEDVIEKRLVAVQLAQIIRETRRVCLWWD